MLRALLIVVILVVGIPAILRFAQAAWFCLVVASSILPAAGAEDSGALKPLRKEWEAALAPIRSMPVQDFGFVRGGQAVGHAHEQLHDLAPRALIRCGPISQRPAIDELGDEILPTLELADFVHGEDVWMVEPRGHLRFLLEAAARRLVGEVGREELDGDRPVQAGVEGAIHLAHAAGPEERGDLVWAHLAPRQ